MLTRLAQGMGNVIVLGSKEEKADPIRSWGLTSVNPKSVSLFAYKYSSFICTYGIRVIFLYQTSAHLLSWQNTNLILGGSSPTTGVKLTIFVGKERARAGKDGRKSSAVDRSKSI